MKTKNDGLVKRFFLISSVCLFLILPASAEVNGFSKTRAFEQNSNMSAAQLYNIGYDFYSQKNWWQASEKFQEALQKNGAYADAWYMLSKCSYEMNQFDLCVEYVENAQKYAGEKPEYTNLKAFSYISLGKFNDADKLFNSVL
ncbi:MAG: tetratricopeptide repeat protein, partial [Treponema sp.]|nr:tetratricopeptide repeat protein [Treponema sp.]